MFRDEAGQGDPGDAFEYVLDPPDRCWNYEPSRAEVFKAFTGAVYTTDAEGWLTYYNDAAAELWGFRPVLGKARWCGSWRLYEPDGTLLRHDESPMAVALRTGVTVRGQQLVLERPDGSRLPIIPSPTPLRDATGTLVAGSNVLLPVSRARPASARPRLSPGREVRRPRAAPAAHAFAGP